VLRNRIISYAAPAPRRKNDAVKKVVVVQCAYCKCSLISKRKNSRSRVICNIRKSFRKVLYIYITTVNHNCSITLLNANSFVYLVSLVSDPAVSLSHDFVKHAVRID
jgi:hypothetical protein